MPKSSVFWFALSAVVLLSVGLWLIWWQWDWLHPEASTTVSNSETLRNVGLLLGGALAFVFAGWRAWVAERQASAAQAQAATAQAQADIAQQQVETAQQGLLNERYQRGAEMLGSPVLSVRLGGIYALGRLAEEYSELYHVQVMQIFCAFVRNPVEINGIRELTPIETGPPHGVPPPLREDVQAIMDAIGVRSGNHLEIEGKARFRLNLSGSDLRGATLIGANLTSAIWEYPSGLSTAESLAYDKYTDLSSAKLCSARLAFAELQKAMLTGACLCNAWIARTDFSEAHFAEANLHGALSWGPILSGATFSIGILSAKGIRQWDLDSCEAAPEKLPVLAGVHDVGTGAPLVWSGKSLIEQS